MKPIRKGGYTQEQIDYLREIGDRTGRSNKEITEMFNLKFKTAKPETSIISIKSRHWIRSYTRTYTPEHIDYLREIAPGRSTGEITKMFNGKFKQSRSEDSIKSVRTKHGILTGNTGRFERGQASHNILPIGAEVIRDDGYEYVKVANPNVWRQRHRIIWEEHNGPVPENHVILFGDGDKNNVDIDNLICVSMRQLAVLNRRGLIQNDADLTRTVINLVDLKLKMGEVSRNVQSK